MADRRQVSVRNGTFSTTLHEAGAGDALLYLHNAAVQDGWHPFLDRLAERFHVLFPLHPGFGESTGVEQIDDPLDMVVYYNDLLDALGVESAHIVGHELGGMFAAELAALSPHRVRKLVLVAPYGLWLEDAELPDKFAFVDPEALRPLLWHDPESAQATAYGAAPANSKDRPEFIIQQARAQSSASRFLWPFPDRGLSKRLHRIQAPTLLVWGASDGLIPAAYGRAFEAAIPAATLATIAQAGNLPMLEQPDRFLAEVVKFLDG